MTTTTTTHRCRRRRPSAMGFVANVVVVFVVMSVGVVHAFGPRPRPRLYAKPMLPRRLHDAERALGELLPGGAAAAGLLGDGVWGNRDEDDDDARSSFSSSRGSRVRFEEYALRAPAMNRALALDVGDMTVDEYTAVLDGGARTTDARGIVPADGIDGIKASTTTATTTTTSNEAARRDGDEEMRVASLDNDSGLDEAPAPTSGSASDEMFAMLAREAAAYVNPKTGKPFEWGDSWMHSRGGGIGTGRPESRPRRITKDGVVEVMPAKGDAGYALVPTSSDKFGLLEFYDNCNGPRWSVQRNWGVGEPCAQAWHGVVCFGGRVVELLLNLNNVACMGSLNVTALATHVHELRYIDLSDNLFTGDLPSELYKMTQLQSIVLSGNRVTGALSEDIGALVNLRHLDLSANAMRGALPQALGNLRKLEVLYLGESGLENKNSFTGPIPESWKGLKSLKHFSLAGNENIGGGIPDWLLNNLDELQELTLSGCGLSGVLPANIDQLKALVTMDLGGNNLSGDIPIDSLARLSHLKHLRLSNNAFSGALSSNVANLVELEIFDVGSNKITGTVPREFFDLHFLEVLDISGNEFTGELFNKDDEMFKTDTEATSNLRIIYANNNRLTGTPATAAVFKRMPFLRTFRVNDNKLDGKFEDDAFDGASELVEFDASNNALIGPMPSSIGAMHTLQSLSFAKNKRFGNGAPIAPELKRCVALKVLDLSGCSFAGAIPSDLFADMAYLSFLRLAANDFSGPIPESIRLTKFLRVLELQGNAFEGVVPSWLVDELNHLEAIELSRNALGGFISDTWYEKTTKSVKPLPAYNERAAGQKRIVRLSQNPLFCPLPPWARLMAATCRETQIHAIEPPVGEAGVYLTITGEGFGPPRLGQDDSFGCVFRVAQSEEEIFIEAIERTENTLRCRAPALDAFASSHRTNTAGGFAVTVNVAVKNEREDAHRLLSKFGELFVYK